jgi:UDP-hydrolysing UDP-N-acetyl-D-glucosamine 2-epimerase
MTTFFAAASGKRERQPDDRRRRICFPITSRAYYGRSQLLIRKLHGHPDLDLQLMLGGSILLDKYSRHVADDIEAGGFTISASLFNVIEGGNHVAMAKTACLTALEFTNGLHAIDPDIVVICGDRFEQLAIAMAAAYLNKTVAHIEGGDLSGSIDESVRHAVTKLAHVHFVTNDDAHRRVLAMGEDPAYVFNTGSLDVERVAASGPIAEITPGELNAYGVGSDVDVSRPFLTVIQHPVTTESENRQHLDFTLRAISALDLPVVCFWPNADAGTGEMSETLRHFREHHENATERMRFITDLPVDRFIALIRQTTCLVGNSSAGIKECSYLGTPVVDIGVRQEGRLRGENVLHAGYDVAEIRAAIKTQLERGRYPASNLYYRPGTSQAIVDVLARTPLYTQKRFHENVPANVRLS